MLRGDSEEYIFFVSHPIITFLAIGLWNNERLKKTHKDTTILRQERMILIAKNKSVIPIKRNKKGKLGK